jgi:hypothetical protein
MDDLINEQRIRGLALTGALDQEIADELGWNVAELLERFGAVLKQARATRRIQLRRRQTAQALEGKGNTTMLTFLGRHELGQNDRSDDAGNSQPPMDAKVG